MSIDPPELKFELQLNGYASLQTQSNKLSYDDTGPSF